MFGKKPVFKALKQVTSKKVCNCGYTVRGTKHEEGQHHKKTKTRKFYPVKGEKYPTNIGDIIDQ